MANQKKRYRKTSTLAASVMLVVIVAHQIISPAHAEQPCEQWSGKALSIQGKVEISRTGQARWGPISNQELLCPGDRLRVDKRSRAAILLPNQTLLRLAEGSAMTFVKEGKEERSWLELLNGVVHFISRTPRSLNIKTPYVNAGIEGTEFAIRVESAQTRIWVFEGQVSATNPQGSLLLASGEAAVAEKGSAPVRKLVVRPRDAVQWALYYPPVIDYREETYAAGPDAPALREALALYRKGDLPAAFARLDAVPTGSRTAQYHDLRAGLLLSVGLVDEARTDIDQVLGLDPNDGTAYALQSVIAVTQNDNEKALALAQQGAELSPQSPVPQIALSYAHQALFDIEKAKQSVEQAVNIAPQDALAWARLAELELSLGNLDSATAAARKAMEHDPNLARTQTVLGFANLTEIEIDEAKTAFDSAIGFDPADPLPRLGLGLAKIRQGDLDEGTEQIETAAILDPDNALVRSYLGKAYYEQKRTGLARTEFAIAKELDPKDPTPWFYDAILKQTENRPVEALHDMQKAIELNDNRAVYRSKFFLDEDLAGRAVSLARVFDNLRFDQLAVNESSKSLTLDPSNYSAHRFLADTYANQPRNKVAQASEILQGQLLQPLNINAVQPVLSETDLDILIGTNPSDAGFNEFTPMFERDGVHFLGAGILGNRSTRSDQAVLTGLYDRLSFSLGQLHYETDGFRENNEARHNLYNVFTQLSLTDKLSVQFEYRRRESNEGDLGLNFDPDLFSENFDRDIKQSISRIGLRYSPTPRSNLIFSGLYSDRREKETDNQGTSNTIDVDKRDGFDFQTQYIYRGELFNITAGFDTYNFSGNTERKNIEDRELFFRAKGELSGKLHDGYLYSNISFPDNLVWTLGLSAVSFKGGQNQLVNFDRILPKIGLQWQLSDYIRLRLAATKTVKRSLIFEQALEPTQIAGFSQPFDDFNGTIAKRYGIGLDINFNKDLSGGLELSRRDIDTPRIFRDSIFIDPADLSNPEGRFLSIFKFEDQREGLYRAYLYWTPDPNWSVSTEYKLERFRRNPATHQFSGDTRIFTAAPNSPSKVRTTTVPIKVSYFNPSGPFVSIGATYLRQKVSDAPEISFQKNKGEFVVMDMSLGYRLPKRVGIVSLDIRNLFDKEFNYYDVNLQTNDPNEPVFLPDRSIFGRILINF